MIENSILALLFGVLCIYIYYTVFKADEKKITMNVFCNEAPDEIEWFGMGNDG